MAAPTRTQTSEKTRYPGVHRIHTRGCAGGRSCKCGKRLRYQAAVWSARDGKRIRKQFKTETAAKDWRDESKGAIRRRMMRAPTSTTVAQAAGDLIEGMASGDILDSSGKPYKPSTVRSYKTSLTRLCDRIGHLKLSSLDRHDHVQPLVDEWRKAGLKPSTVRNQLNPLQVLCRRAVRAGELSVNPTTELDLPKGKGKRTRVADPNEAAALIEALPEFEKAIWATATYAGLRLGEIRALRFSDVDFDAGEIHVRRSWDPIAGVIEVKSEAGRRTVPLLTPLRKILDERRRATDRIGDALVTGRSATEPFTTSNIYKHARKAWEAENARRVAEADDPETVVKLAPIGLHECRHTFGTWGLYGGWNLKQIQQYMGHSDIKTTINVYVHLLGDDAKDAAEKLDGYLETERARASVTSLPAVTSC